MTSNAIKAEDPNGHKFNEGLQMHEEKIIKQMDDKQMTQNYT